MKYRKWKITTDLPKATFGNGYLIWDEKGYAPKPESDRTTESMREFIETACNNHEPMIAALKEALANRLLASDSRSIIKKALKNAGVSL